MKDLETMQREGREAFRQDFTSDCEGYIDCIKGQLDKLDQHTANTWKAAQEILTQDRNQAYTSLVEGIGGMKKYPVIGSSDQQIADSLWRNDTLTDVIENVVKPLYNKTGDN